MDSSLFFYENYSLSWTQVTLRWVKNKRKARMVFTTHTRHLIEVFCSFLSIKFVWNKRRVSFHKFLWLGGIIKKFIQHVSVTFSLFSCSSFTFSIESHFARAMIMRERKKLFIEISRVFGRERWRRRIR